jgi:hypothetical protein
MRKTEVFRVIAQELLLTSTWDFYVDFNLTKHNREQVKQTYDLFITVYLN